MKTGLSLPARVLIASINLYRLFFSPWLGSACRFSPTCSEYSMGALREHGALSGTYFMLTRIARCHPGCAGGSDPVPQRRSPRPGDAAGESSPSSSEDSSATRRKLFP
jgi:uncharacterized protein